MNCDRLPEATCGAVVDLPQFAQVCQRLWNSTDRNTDSEARDRELKRTQFYVKSSKRTTAAPLANCKVRDYLVVFSFFEVTLVV